jgi:tetratricopeptide (TPR) repeat protein
MSADLAQLIASAQASRSPHEALQLARQAAPGPARAAALHEVGHLFRRRRMYDAAGTAFTEAAMHAPGDPRHWLGLGLSLNLAFRPSDSLKALDFAERLLRPGDPLQLELLAIKCRALLRLRRPDEAEACALRGLSLRPGDATLRAALSTVKFATGDWRAALELSDHLTEASPQTQALRKALHNPPAWRGQRVRRLVLFSDEDLGDEVRAASMVAEAAQRVQSLVLECDPRLYRLFARSFKGVEVRGTRGHAVKPWAQGRRFDAMATSDWAAAILGQTCPGAPYLKPDPDARRRWRAEFDRLQRPVIGIAWSGGTTISGRETRAIGLATLSPVILSTRATFVSLQYRDAAAEIAATGLPVIQYASALWRRTTKGPPPWWPSSTPSSARPPQCTTWRVRWARPARFWCRRCRNTT